MIAVPAMQTVPTKFFRCVENLRRLPDTYTSVSENTLIHDARNEFASIAITNGFDRVLWLDSDMTFEPDLLTRMTAIMDEEKMHMLCGLYFKRVMPTEPVIYSRQERRTDPVHGEYIKAVQYFDYPREKMFEVDACGFGAVMTDVALLKAAWDQYGPPFAHYLNLGEDLSFCWRVREMGQKIWCDPTIPVGHIGQTVYTADTYRAQRSAIRTEAEAAPDTPCTPTAHRKE